jgi:hypothetical protein
MKIKPNPIRTRFSPPKSAQLAKETGLKADLKQARTSNATTYGRQANRQDDLVKLSKASDNWKPIHPTEKEPVSAPRTDTKEDSKEQLFTTFMTTLLETVGTEEGILVFEQAKQKAGAEDVEPFLAALALRKAKDRLREMQPHSSKTELREAAKADPQLSANLKLADRASDYLKAVKRSDTSKNFENKSSEGYHLAPEKQVERMADNHRALLTMQETHEQMRAENLKSLQKRQQMREEANLQIQEGWAEIRQKRMAQEQKHFEAYLQTIRGA